jgi:hypothetical protein
VRLARLGRLLAVPLLVITPLGLAACGESSQEKARKQVCAASGEISKQLATLEALPINTSFPSAAVTSLEAIGKSLKEVKDAAPNLEPERKEEVEAGTKAFLTQIGTITASLAATAIKSGDTEAALKAAEPQIKAAESQLKADFKQAFASLKCS